MNCRICGSKDVQPVLELGNHPWANNFVEKKQIASIPEYPLTLFYCNSCGLAQLGFTVAKEIMFGDHTYLSGTTRSLSRHFANVAASVDSKFEKTDHRLTVLDIGSNDGTLLKQFQNLGWDVIGVESSSSTAKIAAENGVYTINAFFNEETAKNLRRKVDVVHASGVFFHLEELHSVCEGIKQILSREGRFVCQFIYAKGMIENLAFDQIYHEHLLYYTLQTISNLLEQHGLEVFECEKSDIHGGSLIINAGHKGVFPRHKSVDIVLAEEKQSGANDKAFYLEFSKKVHAYGQKIRSDLETYRNEGKTIFGLGAPVKGNTLLNFINADRNLIECLVEINETRQGLVAPGSAIPVVLESELDRAPDVYLVLAWNFKDEILQRHKEDVENGVEFYFPIDPSLVSK